MMTKPNRTKAFLISEGGDASHEMSGYGLNRLLSDLHTATANSRSRVRPPPPPIPIPMRREPPFGRSGLPCGRLSVRFWW